MFKTTTIIALVSAALTFPVAAYADAKAEIATASQHAGMAAAAANLAQVHTHLHHAMNCLVGPRDADFDKANMNPCAQQGNGAFPDETNPDIKVKLQNAMSAAADGLAANDEATAKKNAASLQTMLDAIK
ncbi:MAG: hypothetical protein ACXWLT_12305 [Rhizomicrobium sp.]